MHVAGSAWPGIVEADVGGTRLIDRHLDNIDLPHDIEKERNDIVDDMMPAVSKIKSDMKVGQVRSSGLPIDAVAVNMIADRMSEAAALNIPVAGLRM